MTDAALSWRFVCGGGHPAPLANATVFAVRKERETCPSEAASRDEHAKEGAAAPAIWLLSAVDAFDHCEVDLELRLDPIGCLGDAGLFLLPE